jgi:copper chaperone
LYGILKQKIMSTIKLKTNINCGGCIAKITPFLNDEGDIKAWEVDTPSPQKILTVETDNLNEDEIIQIVQQAGFKAESIPV